MATIQQGSAQNKLGKPDGIAQYSKFDLSKHIYTTQRYGEQQVIGVFNAITGDKWKIRNAHELMTYTMQAPLMTPVYMEKDYFQVPRQAILPINWEKISKQPNIGEDIDAQEIGTSVSAEKWSAFLDNINVHIETQRYNWDAATTIANKAKALTKLFKLLIVEEYIYSNGSLLNNLGCHMAAIWNQTTEVLPGDRNANFDEAFELVMSKINYGLVVQFGDDMTPYFVDVNLAKNLQGGYFLTLNEFLNKIRDDANWEITQIFVSTTNTASDATAFNDMAEDIVDFIIKTKNANTSYEEPVDMARLWAYQLVNAEYFTNDKVDYIYNADLFRSYIGHLVIANNSAAAFEYFSWNDIDYEYDYMSAHYFAELTSYDSTLALDYLAALFCYRRSLKYLDYFTGSKTRPLAVGDITINSDAQGRIQVIDVTKSIQEQRFKNAVNRIGRKAEDYAKEMFGIKMHWDYHTPLWLASTRDVVRSVETQNTGEAQMTEKIGVTSKLESYGGNYQFEIEIDRDSILIGLCFYDLERSYSRGVHASFHHVDRYDMFNSYMQYTGDQALHGSEYDAALATQGLVNVFGYVPSYEEFKQEYNEAQGGFITALPGYTFIDGMDKTGGVFRGSFSNQSPDFIRTRPTEMDRFYNSLSGHSLANYFHFIIDFYNEVECTRPMAFNPSIL